MRKVSFEIETDNMHKFEAMEAIARCKDEKLVKIVYYLMDKNESVMRKRTKAEKIQRASLMDVSENDIAE